jgi:hypothetical protein
MPINVVVTGGAGRIAYALIPLLLDGKLFNEDEFVHLRLLDIEGGAVNTPITPILCPYPLTASPRPSHCPPNQCCVDIQARSGGWRA